MIPDPESLVAGQVLLYSTPDSLVDWIIERQSMVAAHVEIYEGNLKSLASRNGIGCGRYDLRMEGLIAVLTPLQVDMPAFSTWFETVNGEAYDFFGLSGFLFGENRQVPEHLFCSAFVSLGFLRSQKQPLFNKLWPSGLTSPSDFLKTPAIHWTWLDTAHFTA